MKRILLYFVVSFITVLGASAQQTIKGTVIDETGDGLPGVTVAVPGTTTGTTTDVEGKYTLQVAAGSSLTFSFIGYKTVTEIVGNQSVINVTLET
ncbi:MAG: carboxypeptidase-like regulatory domain-containing protein [Spirosomaceae bacterium]|nr:carboxypeptidase-like regulatory domain-containing protein [Spirosomataceae bacterium]